MKNENLMLLSCLLIIGFVVVANTAVSSNFALQWVVQ